MKLADAVHTALRAHDSMCDFETLTTDRQQLGVNHNVSQPN